MRLRNVPEAKGIVEASPYVVKITFPAMEDGSLPGKDPGAVRCPGNLARPAVSGQGDFFGRKPLSGAGSAERPIWVEIGCGKGGFLLEMARRHPEVDFLGVEMYESVLYRVCEKLEDMGRAQTCDDGPAAETGTASPYSGTGAVRNIRLLCADARALPAYLSAQGVQVDRLYLNFSDPWPKARNAKRRLTSPQFLSLYEGFLRDGGELIFKTDNVGLFDYSLEVLEEEPRWEVVSVTRDLHGDIRRANKIGKECGADDASAEGGTSSEGTDRRPGTEALADGGSSVEGTDGPEENVMTEYEIKFSNLGHKICRVKAVCHPEYKEARRA